MTETRIEPWLRGTLTEMEAVTRGVVHALVLAQEDVVRWCGGLTDAEIHAQPLGLPSVAFHLRHITGSLDRLLTYAEGRQLSAQQLAALEAEEDGSRNADALIKETLDGVDKAILRTRELAKADMQQPRQVGRKLLPTSLGGLLVHVADHTQRHLGQAITTAKVLLAQR